MDNTLNGKPAYTVLRDLTFYPCSRQEKLNGFRAQILKFALESPMQLVCSDDIVRDLNAVYAKEDSRLPSAAFTSLAAGGYLLNTEQPRKSKRKSRTRNWTSVWRINDRAAAEEYANTLMLTLNYTISDECYDLAWERENFPLFYLDLAS